MTYNPDEPRDEHGKWTASAGGSHTAPGRPDVHVSDQVHADAGKMVSDRAAAVAKTLDYPTEKMFISDKEHTFELNGTQRTAAGMYWHDSDMIELAAQKLTFAQDGKLYPNGIAGVTAHEIMHAKFEALQKDYRAERDAMTNDPDYKATLPKWEDVPGSHEGHQRAVYPPGIKLDAFMKPDGTLQEPYASRYPVYTKYTDTMIRAGGTEGFAKTDGVSSYSKDYWTDWANGKTSTDHALHETLAEIARLRYEHGIKHDAKVIKQQHDARVAELKKMGAEWAPEHEAEWRKNSKVSVGFMRFKRGEVEGKKVYFATGKGSPDRLSHAWSDLYNLVDWNWKRRNKK